MITIVDYGVGNLFSLRSSLNYLGIEHKVSGQEEDLRNADRIILPGVGAFADAMGKLDASGLREPPCREAGRGKPLMGNCLGMQLLFERGWEYGEHRGLGLIPGEIVSLKDELREELNAGRKEGTGGAEKIPHMGWNSLSLTEKGKSHPLLRYTSEGDYVYFVHSYCGKFCDSSLLAVTEYGVPVAAAVARDNVMGTQFHPEKSGEAGLRILKAFSEINL